MKIISKEIDGLLIIEPKVFRDSRGFFLETYHQQRYFDSGIQNRFVQDNISYSAKGVLRGLHFQIERPQAKLVQVLKGKIFDVAVDLRPDSSTFGKWAGVTLSGENLRQFFIPEGFAHGFCVLSEMAMFSYKCSDFYFPEDEGGILWSDPDVAVQWPTKAPILSDKDLRLPLLTDVPSHRLPKYFSRPEDNLP